jgi:hypothetical protein
MKKCKLKGQGFIYRYKNNVFAVLSKLSTFDGCVVRSRSITYRKFLLALSTNTVKLEIVKINLSYIVTFQKNICASVHISTRDKPLQYF